MRPEEQNDTTQNSVNYFQQPNSQPVIPPTNPVSPVSQSPQQIQQQQSQQPLPQQYIQNNQSPTPPIKNKFNVKLIAIIAAVILLIGVGTFVLLGFLNKDNSKTGVASGNSSDVASNTTRVASTGEIKMDMKDAINTGGTGLVLYHPSNWTQISAFSSPLVYGTPKITKNNHDMSLYYLVVNGYLGIDDDEHAALTLNTLHERGLAYLSGRLSNYVGTSLIGTEISVGQVTIGEINYLKVVGKSTKGYMQPNYIAYFGFYNNESLKMVHAPIAIVLFIASDDAKDISYGEDVLKACIATIKPY